MGYEKFISIRYLKAKRKQTFISIITLISVAGVALGVAALIIVTSVMSGFQRELKQKIIGTKAHLIITAADEKGIWDYEITIQSILDTPGITAAAPFVISQGMLQSADYLHGVVLIGIDPEREKTVSNIHENMISGRLPEPGQDELIIGKELASRLGVEKGDQLFVLTRVVRTAMGLVPKTSISEIVGIFDTGMFEYDSNMAYTSLESAQRLYDIGPELVTGIAGKTQRLDRAQKMAAVLQQKLGDAYTVRSWDMMNRELFSALRLERTVMFIILFLIIVVAAFNIIGTLIMMTMEKNRDIAILKAMGATQNSITRIFLFEGFIIGLVGTLTGTILGLLSCWALDKYEFIKLPPDIYYIETLPVLVEPVTIIFIVLSAIILSVIAAVYPAWQAGRIDPVEALRYE